MSICALLCSTNNILNKLKYSKNCDLADIADTDI